MELVQKVKNTIEEHGLLKKGSHVIVGFSGGPDSLCLLTVLQSIKEEFSLHIFAVHVNHQLRGEDANQDQCYAQSICAAMQIPCRVVSCDVAEMAKRDGVSTEDAGRKVRYQAFFEEKEKIENQLKERNQFGEVVIAVAQNQNDQAETVLMRFMRGTGIDGLGGIEYKRKDGVVRPLLDISRKEIEQYCMKKKCTPCIDQTNLQAVYTRNRIRLELLPYMEEHFNENVIGALTRLSKIVREDASFLNDASEKALELCRFTKQSCENQCMKEQSTILSLRRLQQQPAAIRKRILRHLLKEKGLFQNVSAVHLEHADQLIRLGRQPSIAEFPERYCMRIAYEKIEILCEDHLKEQDKNEKKDTGQKNEGQDHELKGQLKEKLVKREDVPDLKKLERNIRAFDFESIKAMGIPFVLRTRKAGDFIRPFGMKGTKKLQDYFVDRKIPKEIRDFIPLVACGSEILWIVGEATNETFKVTKNSEVILLLEYHK